MTNPLKRLAEQRKQARNGRQQTGPSKRQVAPENGISLLSDEKKLGFYQSAVEVAESGMRAYPAMGNERTAAKRTALVEIMPYVTEYVEKGHIYPNSVAVQAMIWLADVGDIGEAITLALYLTATGNQHLPTRFKRREISSFIAQAVYDWANELLKSKKPAEPHLNTMVEAIDNGLPLHEILTGMVYSMAARHAELKKDWPAVVDYCEKSIKANPDGAGVKKLLSKAKGQIYQDIK